MPANGRWDLIRRLKDTLARISCWPPEDGSICDTKHVGVNFTRTFSVFLVNIELWVHELVIIETGHIDARFKHEVITKI